MFNGVSVHNIKKWLESIHNDTLQHGSEEEQYVLEQQLIEDYLKAHSSQLCLTFLL